MPSFMHDGLALAYDDLAPSEASGRVMVLVHGFASNRREGWRRTGWFDALQRRGSRVVALDLRGHGESAKSYDPGAYVRSKLSGDVLALMDHLDLPRADLFGYSMGAHVVLGAALAAPDRVTNLVLGGVGGRMLDGRPADAGSETMRDAMLAEDPRAIADPIRRSFRHFVDEQGEDRQALAAFASAPAEPLDFAAVGGLRAPVLAVAGQRDGLAGDPAELAAAFVGGRGVQVPGLDHFSAIPHALTKATVFDFLDGLLDDPFERRW